MPTSSVGRASNAGITLVEMLVVVALVGLMAAISFPSVGSGIDSLRISGATDNVVAIINDGLNRAERVQDAVVLIIDPRQGSLEARSNASGWMRTFRLPEGVQIRRILPEHPADEGGERIFFLYPGGSAGRLGLELENRRGVRRIVRVDPITGVPQIERVEQVAGQR